MTRRIKRYKDFEVTLSISNDDFIKPPRIAQRNWLLNRALYEFADDLMRLDALSARFVAGTDRSVLEDRTHAVLTAQEIMEDWQIPVVRAMAEIVGETHGHVLEVGFGRGVSSTFIQDLGVRSHTIIECNNAIVAEFQNWRRQYPDREIRLIHGMWQDVTEQLKSYDGILFHAYPLNEGEFLEYVVHSTTFAAHFFSTAAEHLQEGGVFTYLTNETDSLSRGHQRELFRQFSSFTLSVIGPLTVPKDSKDDLWGDTMVVVRAVK